ncbi:phosphoribosylaminoimidazolesuccinocarboxamide synthase [Candidatus Parcubacteria bacterium]|nr:phosphoribosylaminoimidazolesuccinocarboxamide synthase [Candidatus Parcubacteria bacterium]
MGANIPAIVTESKESNILLKCGLGRIHQGKVRDTYSLSGGNLLMCATDRLSIFDFVLPDLVPQKGEYLTALTYFWFTEILSEYENHLVAYGDDVLPYIFPGEKDEKLASMIPVKRCMVVKNLNILPFELIYRQHIGGSVYKEYLKTGMAGGHKITPNLPQWSKLNKPIFTPSTKEDSGHDINVTAKIFNNLIVDGEKISFHFAQVYAKAYAYAEKRGILILDTKMESDNMILADEVLTPDSSRFVDEKDWRQAMVSGGAPAFYDKQIVRDWGKEVVTPFGIIGINNLDPDNPEHIDFVHNSLRVPSEIIDKTAERYREIFIRLVRGWY